MFALGLLFGTVWAIAGGVIVAIWKYFKRSPITISPAAVQANDKGLFIAALVLAVFLTGKAIYLDWRRPSRSMKNAKTSTALIAASIG